MDFSFKIVSVYLDIKNYGALYAEPVAHDLVHPDTTPINVPYLDNKNYEALYMKLVTNDQVHPETVQIVLPYLDKPSPLTWCTLTPPDQYTIPRQQKLRSAVCRTRRPRLGAPGDHLDQYIIIKVDKYKRYFIVFSFIAF